jgi:hypothetical protein
MDNHENRVRKLEQAAGNEQLQVVDYSGRLVWAKQKMTEARARIGRALACLNDQTKIDQRVAELRQALRL